MMHLFALPSFIAETIAFICSLFALWNSNYPIWLKLLTPYLLLTLAVEFLGYYITESLHLQSNHPLFNVYVPLSILFYLHLLGKIINDAKVSSIISIGMVVFGLFALSNILWIQGLQDFNTYTFVVGGFLIAAFCIVYFVGLLDKNGIVIFWTDPAFWLCTGLFIYYLTKIIFYASVVYLIHTGQSTMELNRFFHSINYFLICTLYAFISINFLCRPRRPI